MMQRNRPTIIRRRLWSPLLMLLLLAISLPPPATAASEKPNILLILADDLGYSDLSIQGCEQFETPHIDSIALNGVRFTEGYVCNSVCAPSRAGLLTGRIGIGFEANLPSKLPEYGLNRDLDTMADSLKSAGYGTYCIGKWHLGVLEHFYPTNRGFDWFCGLREGSRSYWYDPSDCDEPGSHRAIEINGEQVEFEGYVTDYFTDLAIEQIESHRANTPNKPFFMYLSYTAPHGPMHGKPELIEKFSHIEPEKRRIYAAMVASLDEGVGRVLQCLEKHDASQNTMVVFLSDNGGPTPHNASNNKPLKGTKGSLWEGGVRVPFMIQWPNQIPPGQTLDSPVMNIDLLPTFETVAHVRKPLETNGINLMPYLDGSGRSSGERDFYWRRGFKTQCALRSGEYKWMENRRKNLEYLYRITDDASEKNNLIKQQPELAARLKQQYKAWEASVPDPAFDPSWKPKK